MPSVEGGFESEIRFSFLGLDLERLSILNSCAGESMKVSSLTSEYARMFYLASIITRSCSCLYMSSIKSYRTPSLAVKRM